MLERGVRPALKKTHKIGEDKMRAATIKFYLANSGFDKEELSDVISESLFQLELLGYPSITKKVESLVSGLSRSPKEG
jgi:hypothetical protein